MMNELPEKFLRDWFAGQALVGMLASGDWTVPKVDQVAIDCYDYADAMMHYRKEDDDGE